MNSISTELWWKHAVFYCLDVETFSDSNGDGVGDFQGLAQRVEYLSDLGVTALWLLPFFPSGNGDDGYDVTDYYSIDPRFGTLGDLVEFMEVAQERGLRVLLDLPFNHTSNQHPWFQRAREARESPYHDYYVWADEKPEEGPPVVFPGEVDEPWTFDEQAGRWYLHHFYDFQPDLNIANDAVRREFEKIMGYWLKLGFSGFRIDALPFMLDQIGIAERHRLDDPHEFARQFHSYVIRRRGDAMLLGEANVDGDELPAYFGEGDEMQLLYGYQANAALYLALARQQAEPISQYLKAVPRIPSTCAWLNFARVHDEISLERLTPEERQEVFDILAPDESWQSYGRGIRRRLPSLLHNDRRRLLCVLSFVMSLPGSPCLLYGEEIGLGDQLDLPGRIAARVPMQWSPEPNAGFSRTTGELVRPLVTEEGFEPESVNVTNQRSDPDSTFAWTRRLVIARRECPELGWGEWSLIDLQNPAVLAHRCDWDNSSVVALHNFSPDPQQVKLKLEEAESLAEIIADRPYGGWPQHPEDGLDLAPYGWRWFRLRTEPAEQQ
jgi:maltose alpha-D-glucosyltransferase/alpha-amylase